jgi:hypothetical protein
MEIKGYLTRGFLFMVSSVFLLMGDVSLVRGAVYEWVDGSGLSHYTDDPSNIPQQYRNKARKSDVADETVAPAGARPQRPESVRPKAVLYGGHNEFWWRNSFKEIREEIVILKNRIPDLKAKLTETARSRTRFHKPSDRVEYNAINDEISRTEARIKELEQKLVELDDKGATYGVPREWRE